MKNKQLSVISAVLTAVFVLTTLSSCGGRAAVSEPAAAAAPERQDGERFEETIMVEGTEETVRYEHVRSEAVGVEMDYDYERFARRSDAGRERFVSVYDLPESPVNYLELTYRAEDAESVAASVRAELSQDYDLVESTRELERAGSCLRIEASVLKGTGQTASEIRTVYIIPAADGCRVAEALCAIEAAEGIGRRFDALLDTLSVIEMAGRGALSAEQALSAVRNYCYSVNPDLASVEEGGEYPVYWEIASADEREIVVLFRSYTGALTRYYIDPVSGEAYVTEYVPGISSAEEKTGERLNVWTYLSGGADLTGAALSDTGIWQTASMVCDADGSAYPEYHVRFTETEIVYGHVKDGAFAADHADAITRLAALPSGGFLIQAESANGVRYTYQTSESDPGVLEYYETWDERDFADAYRGGASLSRSN